MALIDLQTDLKSLKYSKDRIGGGTSGQPFIQKPIPDSFSAVGNTGGLDVLTRGGTLAIGKTADDVSRLSKLLLTGATFQGPFFTIKQNVLSRQGVQTQASPRGLNEGFYLPTSTIAQAAVSATGLHFNKQGLNPIPGLPGSLTTYSDVVQGTFLNSGIKAVENNRLVNFAESFVNTKESSNTLYSYPGGPGSILGLGKTSINIPSDQRTGINTEGTTLDGYFGRPGVKNPLYDAYSSLVPPDIEIPLASDIPEYLIAPIPAERFKSFTNPRPVSLDYRRYLSLSYNAGLADEESIQIRDGLAFKNNNLITLKTAPKGDQASGVNFNVTSKYALENGLGRTLYQPITGSATSQRLRIENNINFDVTSKPSEDLILGGNNQNEVLESSKAFTYDQDQLIAAPTYRETGQIQDFRTQLRNKGKEAKAVGADVLAPSYTEENIEKRVHLGNPGTKGDISDYTKGKKDYTTGIRLGALDTLNALPVYQSSAVKQDSEAPVNDLVKFRIAILDSNGTSTKSYIHFRAFLDNISDNYSADWGSHKYVGRGENFWTYGGFDRQFNLSWTVYAQSKEELIPMYKKLNYLASSLAPDYNNGFMRGVLCQLTIGGYVYEQPGFITNLTYELTDQSTWEIGINDKGFTDPENRGDALVKELPHMIKVSGFNFRPIHKFIPQIQKSNGEFVGANIENGPSRFIALDNGFNNNYDNK
jgi:hypothetical protein